MSQKTLRKVDSNVTKQPLDQSRVVVRSMLPLQYAAQPSPSTFELGSSDGEYFGNGSSVDTVVIRVYPLFVDTGISP